MRKTLKLVLVASVALVWLGFFLVRTLSSNGPQVSPDSFSAQAALIETRLVEEIRDYKTWTRVNPQPVNMDAAVAQLCAAPTGPRAANKNPHLNKLITVYVNEIGRRAMVEERVPKFPQGSVIVKEKLSAPDSTQPELLTVMIKREKGFNPESGDWEYMVTNGAGTEVQARGRISSCQACHEMNRNTDYVNRNYLPRTLLKALR